MRLDHKIVAYNTVAILEKLLREASHGLHHVFVAAYATLKMTNIIGALHYFPWF